MLIGELAAIGAALVWSVSSLIIKPISTKFSPSSINSIAISVGWVILTIILVPWGKLNGLSFTSWHSIAYVIGSGIIGVAIGNTLEIKALSLLDISRVCPVTYSSWFLFTAIIAAIFLGEPITYYTILGALFIVIGVTLLSGFSKVKDKEKIINTNEVKGIIFALISGLCWAGGTNLLKLGLYEINPLVLNVIRLPFVILPLVISTSIREGVPEYSRYNPKDVVKIGIAGSIDYALGGILFFTSVHLVGAIKATILSSTSPLFIAPLSVIFLKEKLTKHVILGIITCSFGMLLTIL